MTHEEQQARVEAIYAKWRGPLGLDGWSIGLKFFPDEFIDQSGRASNPSAVAATFVRWQYMHGTIWVNTAAAEGETDTEIERHIVHELVHFLINEMRDLCAEDHEIFIKHEERVCTMITSALLRSRDIMIEHAS